jgi:hypothetical protein
LHYESEQDLRAQTFTVGSLRAAIAQSEKRIAQITSSHRQQPQAERVETADQLRRLRQDDRALIDLDSNFLQRGEKKYALIPGMRVNAEIHLGTRTVLEYLLSPLQKTLHEAGRER